MGQHAHCNFGTGGLGNFPPTGGSCTPDAKKTRQRAENGRPVPRCRRSLAFIVAQMKRTFSLALARSHRAAARPWCTFHSPPPPSEDAVCRVQPCLSAACSRMAWCGCLWLRLLSRPDRCMMNHTPAASRGTQASGPALPEPRRSSEPSQQEEPLSSRFVVHGD